jgi:hypothetical protein
MMKQTRHAAAAVTRSVLDLFTDLAQRAAFPRHGSRREVPLWMTRNMRRLEVAWAVAGIAWQRRRSVIIRAPHHQRLMEPHPIRLVGAVAGRMTVHAPGMLKHPAGLRKQGERPCTLVPDRGEVRCRTQIVCRCRY